MDKHPLRVGLFGIGHLQTYQHLSKRRAMIAVMKQADVPART
jgi:hypothetical protein